MLRLASLANRSFITVRKEKEWGNLSWFLFRFIIDIPSYTSYEKAGFRYLTNAYRFDRYIKYIK